MLGRPGFLAAALAVAACSGTSKTPAGNGAGGDGSLTIFVTTEIKGQIEPCGCTSDPMGDLARTAALIAQTRAGGHVLYVDGGSLLYTELPMRDARRTQEELKAELLVGALGSPLEAAAVGLGPYDLAAGPGKVRPARQAANLAAGAGVPIEAPKVVTVGGVKVGVFGVVAPELVAPFGLKADDPRAAAKQAIAALRGDGARVIVGLAHMTRMDARTLAREVPGIDFLVIGRDAPEPDEVAPGPDRVGDTWLVQPANRGQVITRLDVTVRGEGAFTDAIGEDRAAAEIEVLDERIARLERDVAQWEKDPSAEAAFVASQRAELDRLKAERAALANGALRVPATGSWFVMRQVGIRKKLPCDEALVAKKIGYDEAVGRANLEAAKGQAPPAPAEGAAGYAGLEECGYCHEEAVEFWNQTRHAGAWETLVKGGKQLNLECVYCHVTGFDEPGGVGLAALVAEDAEVKLHDVQCEVCHGPSSLHVDADGKEKPSSLVLSTPESRCITCHNELHSDTFQYEAYLRDVTGPGHGEKLHAKLGDGPTGRELRGAALDKAGAAIGRGCPK